MRCGTNGLTEEMESGKDLRALSIAPPSTVVRFFRVSEDIRAPARTAYHSITNLHASLTQSELRMGRLKIEIQWRASRHFAHAAEIECRLVELGETEDSGAKQHPGVNHGPARFQDPSLGRRSSGGVPLAIGDALP